MEKLDEFGLIAELLGRLPAPREEVEVGPGDDAAVTAWPAGAQLVATCDALVEGVHFTDATCAPEDVGFKSVAVSVSDIAAMGGEPLHALLSLSIPPHWPANRLMALYDGVAEACRAFGCGVIGGNVTKTDGPLVVTSTLLGSVPPGTALRRSGARPGDVLFVTGWLGAAGAGLRALLELDPHLPGDELQPLAQAHRRPRPPVAAGRILREAGATACDDISDGLASELNEIAGASRVRLRVELARLPIPPAVRNFARRRGEDATDYALYGGEDYQLVGTAPPVAFARALAACEALGIRLSAIGRVEAGDGVIGERPDGRLDLIQPRGFNHFA
ncbi:MAG: thiamine-phosphate kinase [Thermoflavifilum sp.]|nr:thiamine-phosphate kinase [Thermoflavifilum sp.]MCL6513679.1 thiamine-phosphate kinase [Alicyclobacillus sp.]